MDIGGRPGGGVFAAVGVHYLRSGGAWAEAVLAADAAFSQVLAEHVAMVPEVLRYRPGEFFLRELPPWPRPAPARAKALLAAAGRDL